MAERAKIRCTRCGKGTKNRPPVCDECRGTAGAESRPSAAKRGYDKAWQKRRIAFLSDNPLCADCMKDGIVTPATVVDHVIPHRGDPVKFHDTGNLQPLCERHHNIKTAKGQ